MLLGALVDAGVPLDVPAAAVAALAVEQIRLVTEPVTRHGLGATRVHVHAPESSTHRTWSDVRALLAERRPARPPSATAPWRCSSGWPSPRAACTGSRPRRCTSTRSARSTRSPTSSASSPGSRTSASTRLTASPGRAGQRLGPRRARRRPDPRPGRAGAARRHPGGRRSGAGRDVHPHRRGPGGRAGGRVDDAARRSGSPASAWAPAAATPSSCRTSSALVLGEPADARTGRAGRAGGQRRRPRPAAVARRPRHAVRRRAPPTPG